MKKVELIEMIQKAINHQTDLFYELKDDTNPQVIRIAQKANGKRQALSDVLAALKGNSVYLEMLTK